MIEQLTTETPPSYQVREVCLALSLSPSGYYAHRHKAERPRRRQDLVLTQAIHHVFEESGGTYGSPRLVHTLGKRGVPTSKTRVRRLIKSAGLCLRQKSRTRPECPRAKRLDLWLPSLIGCAPRSTTGRALPQRHHPHPYPRRMALYDSYSRWLLASVCGQQHGSVLNAALGCAGAGAGRHISALPSQRPRQTVEERFVPRLSRKPTSQAKHESSEATATTTP